MSQGPEFGQQRAPFPRIAAGNGTARSGSVQDPFEYCIMLVMRVEPSELPSRTAHVLHALMEAWTNAGGSAPLTTSEVCEYDGEALTARDTAAALSHARRLGLADGAAGLWFATSRAWEMRRALEDRFLSEVS